MPNIFRRWIWRLFQNADTKSQGDWTDSVPDAVLGTPPSRSDKPDEVPQHADVAPTAVVDLDSLLAALQLELSRAVSASGKAQQMLLAKERAPQPWVKSALSRTGVDVSEVSLLAATQYTIERLSLTTHATVLDPYPQAGERGKSLRFSPRILPTDPPLLPLTCVHIELDQAACGLVKVGSLFVPVLTGSRVGVWRVIPEFSPVV